LIDYFRSGLLVAALHPRRDNSDVFVVGASVVGASVSEGIIGAIVPEGVVDTTHKCHVLLLSRWVS
jgi:hypothetical protein